jgi:hypothetical protein
MLDIKEHQEFYSLVNEAKELGICQFISPPRREIYLGSGTRALSVIKQINQYVDDYALNDYMVLLTEEIDSNGTHYYLESPYEQIELMHSPEKETLPILRFLVSEAKERQKYYAEHRKCQSF